MRMAYSTNGGKTYNGNYAETRVDANGHFEFPMPPVGGGQQFYVYYPNEEKESFFYRNFTCAVVDSPDDRNYCNFDPNSGRVGKQTDKFEIDPPLLLRTICYNNGSNAVFQIVFSDYDAPYSVVYTTDWLPCQFAYPYITISEFPKTMSLHHYYDIELQTKTVFGIGYSFDHDTINPISYR
jgi:hypothetical protein